MSTMKYKRSIISREDIIQLERSIEELKKHIPSIVGSLRRFIDLLERVVRVSVGTVDVIKGI